MDIKKREILVTGAEARKSKKTEKTYVVINFIDLGESVNNQYSVMSEDINILQKIKGMEKWLVNIKISGGNYGVKMEISDFIEKLGQV